MASSKQRENNEALITGAQTPEQQAQEAAANKAPITQKFSHKTGFRVKKLVTVPSLVMKIHGEERILRFDTPITVSTVRDPKKPDEKPANVATVTDMETGEPFIFILPSVVHGELEKSYDGEAYVGKIFQIKNLGRDPAKRYVNFGIAEVETDE